MPWDRVDGFAAQPRAPSSDCSLSWSWNARRTRRASRPLAGREYVVVSAGGLDILQYLEDIFFCFFGHCQNTYRNIHLNKSNIPLFSHPTPSHPQSTTPSPSSCPCRSPPSPAPFRSHHYPSSPSPSPSSPSQPQPSSPFSPHTRHKRTAPASPSSSLAALPSSTAKACRRARARGAGFWARGRSARACGGL